MPGPSGEHPRIVDLGEDGDDTAGIEEAEAVEDAEAEEEEGRGDKVVGQVHHGHPVHDP